MPEAEEKLEAQEAPYPGSKDMPRWEVASLIGAPQFTWRSWTMLLGPGLVMGASAIGGGEWLTGPLVTAQYGAALLWLATLSILGQVLYNIEISRYTLYSGEPIFTGKFRIVPGPMFWLFLYLLLDFGSLLPYLASNAAIPFSAMILRRMPDPNTDAAFLKTTACILFLVMVMPLVIGGKVYTSIKWIMSFKLVVVFGFLMLLAVFYSTSDTWYEIVTGFFRFGNVPVKPVGAEKDAVGVVANVFTSWFSGTPLPPLDYSMIGILAAMAAISGNGGLTNTPISNYTRDQGWGMGYHVGAIPSIVGGHSIALSHVGKVFLITAESLRRWKDWVWHVRREQIFVWMPACFLGLALPSMLSMQFLPRGTKIENKWLAAGMTAEGVANAVAEKWGTTFGPLFWYMTLFCGFLVLATSMVATADGVLRRWVDVFWTSSARLRKWDVKHIGKFYFSVLCIYVSLGLLTLILVNGDKLLVWSTNIYNYALGFSCWHTLVVNTTLLPRELKPGWLTRIGLLLAGSFFMIIAIVTTIDTLGGFK